MEESGGVEQFALKFHFISRELSATSVVDDIENTLKAYITTVIRLRYDYDRTTTKN